MDKELKIAIEAISLSESNVTGIYNVIINYLRALQRIDKNNEYHLIVRDRGIRFDKGDNWQIVTFPLWINENLTRVRNKWLELRRRYDRDKSLLTLVFIVGLRFVKILLGMMEMVLFPAFLIRYLRNNDIDIYFGTSCVFSPRLPFVKAKKVYLLYDLVWKLFPKTMELANKIKMTINHSRSHSNSDLIISISERTKHDYCEIFNCLGSNIHPIHLAADKNLFRVADNKSIDDVKSLYRIRSRYVLSVSTLEPRKNLVTLIKAFNKLNDIGDVQLVLAGMEGWMNEKLFKVIDEYDMKERVLITGYVDEKNLAPLYTGAEVFVYPSFYEGFGLPVLEAMQCGTPVIVADNSSLPEVVGDAGILVDTVDVEGYTKAMRSVLTDRNFRNSLRKKGIKRAEMFSWDASAVELLDQFTRLASSNALNRVEKQKVVPIIKGI